ncbi:DUF3068 domain-containing protein [Rhodococcus sp. NPDC003318]|uniref:DUF3068 domain-containing protein n=1 Tax=Rhodococcus sp. NPDC003318 TaxID=3364503 RepID=UPI0036CAB50D
MQSRLRSALPSVLMAVGTFLLTVAVLVPTYAAPRIKKLPLDLAVTTVSTAEATVVDSVALAMGRPKIETGVPVIAQRHVTVQDPVSADMATIEAGLTIRRTDKRGDAGLLSASVDRVSVNRSTGMPTGDVATIQTSPTEPAVEVPREGLQYKFPFGVEPRSYPYFDLNMRESFPLDFVEETEIDGVPAYHFSQTVGPSDTIDALGAPGTELTLPGTTWGMDTSNLVTMHRIYSTVRDLWVEPVTGLVLDGRESVRQAWGRTPDDMYLMPFLEMTTGFDEATRADQVEMATTYRRMIQWGTVYGPIGAGVVGTALLVAGVVLGVRGRRCGRPLATEPGTEPMRLFAPAE